MLPARRLKWNETHIMKNPSRIMLVITLMLALMSPLLTLAADTAATDPIREHIQEAINRVKPALVQIHAVRTAYHNGREIKGENTGSGTIISPEGHVVTNHHVAGHAAKIFCFLENREKIEACVIGTDPLSDIAILKLLPEKPRTFPYAQWGVSAGAHVGDRVLAMGSPVSLSQSVTLGIISNIDMTLPHLLKKARQEVRLDGENVGSYVLWIGHDAAIFPGNSGGPLVDLAGDIIGVNEIAIGLGGAIPSDIAAPIANELIENRYIRRSWTGLEVQPLLVGQGYTEGVLVSDVAFASPAEKAGFMPGDIITRISEHSVRVQYIEDLPLFHRIESDLPIGEQVTVDCVRNGDRRTIDIVPEAREQAEHKTTEMKQWGITVRDLSMAAVRQLQRDSRDGVLLTSVSPSGPGGDGKPALTPGDILSTVDGQTVRSTEDLISVTRKLTDDETDPVPVLVEFDRGYRRYLTLLRIGIEEPRDQGVEVKKAWLPIATQVITREMAQALSIPDSTGVRITQIYNLDSNPAKALAIGDLILKIDGEPIPAAAPEDGEVFESMIRQYRTRTTVELTVRRNGENKVIPVELIRSPAPAREMKKYQDLHFEFTARDLCFDDRASENLPRDLEGVRVIEVSPGSWSALGELAVGDIILRIDDTDIPDVQALRRKLDEIEHRKPDVAVFKILRGVRHLFLEMELN